MVGLHLTVSTNQLKHTHARTNAMNDIKGYCIFQPEFGDPVILVNCTWLDNDTIMGSFTYRSGTKCYDKQFMVAKATTVSIARDFVQKRLNKDLVGVW